MLLSALPAAALPLEDQRMHRQARSCHHMAACFNAYHASPTKAAIARPRYQESHSGVDQHGSMTDFSLATATHTGSARCFTICVLHDGNTARFRANDRLIGQPPDPSAIHWIRPVTLAHWQAALWQAAPNPDYTYSSPPTLSHSTAPFC